MNLPNDIFQLSRKKYLDKCNRYNGHKKMFILKHVF